MGGVLSYKKDPLKVDEKSSKGEVSSGNEGRKPWKIGNATFSSKFTKE